MRIIIACWLQREQKVEVLNEQIKSWMKKLQLKPEIKELFLHLFEKQMAIPRSE